MSFTNDKNSDNYITNAEDWLRIKDYIPKDKKIWSPFYCDGKQKEYFNDMGFDIIHQDRDFLVIHQNMIWLLIIHHLVKKKKY